MQWKEKVLFQCTIYLKKEPRNFHVSFIDIFCYHEDCYRSRQELLV